jgi:succinoglycan biosynthesis protein ExoO
MVNRSDLVETVSVIMPTYNSARTVDRAIESVLAQTHRAWQLIVVDDASTDDTVERIEACRRGFEDRISLVRATENGGPAKARNRAMSAGNGEWIAVLDADDAWRKQRLEVLLRKATETDADAVCDNLLGFDDHAGVVTQQLFAKLPVWLDIVAAVAPSYAGDHSLGYLKPVVRRSFVQNHRIRYDEGLRTSEDLVYLLNLLTHGARILGIGEPHYIYTMQVGSRSGKLSRSTHSIPRDADLARSLAGLLEDGTIHLSLRERQAIYDRISYLEKIAPLAQFRDARLRGKWGRALFLIGTSPAVRARLKEIAKQRLRPSRQDNL